MTEDDMIAWIDQASLEDLLRGWRFGAIGGDFFIGDVGKHYSTVMFAKRDKDPVAWSVASKTVGWRN